MDLVFLLLRVYDSLASIFSTCWLIVGAVYVYGPYAAGTGRDRYCTRCDDLL